MEDKKKEKILILFILIGLVVLIITKIISYYNSKNKIDYDDSIIVLNDNSKFFVVSSCVDKLIKYTMSKDSQNVLKLLEESYKQSNNIDENNVLNYFPILNGNYSFSARKIYQQQISSTTYKYYVYGNYYQELISGIGDKQPLYLVVYLYTENMTFSVEPYDGTLFKEEV